MIVWVVVRLLRLERRRLERATHGPFDRQFSARLDAVTVALEALGG